MKIGMKKISIMSILLVVFLSMSKSAVAVDLINPFFDFIGHFNYDQTTNELSLSNMSVTQVTYLDGTSAGNDDISDSDVTWEFFSGGLFNSAAPNNLVFGGATSFRIKDGGGYVFLTGKLSNFTLSQFCPPFPPGAPCQDPSLNSNYQLNSLWNLVVDPNYLTSPSRYIRELGSVLNRNDGVIYNTDINIDFTVTSGDNEFINNAAGTLSGKLVLMPEPVSSLLFIVGGVILAVRMYRKRSARDS